jgi:hypothetical protein
MHSPTFEEKAAEVPGREWGMGNKLAVPTFHALLAASPRGFVGRHRRVGLSTRQLASTAFRFLPLVWQRQLLCLLASVPGMPRDMAFIQAIPAGLLWQARRQFRLLPNTYAVLNVKYMLTAQAPKPHSSNTGCHTLCSRPAPHCRFQAGGAAATAVTAE